MNNSFEKIIQDISIPAIAIIFGTSFGINIDPSNITLSSFQHLAAGIILAAISLELLPKIIKVQDETHRMASIIGLILGGFIMIFLRTYINEEKAKQYLKFFHDKSKIPWGLIISVAIDIFTDGFLIGAALSFARQQKSAFIMAIALAIEISLIGITIGVTMKDAKLHYDKAYITGVILGIIITIGAIFGNIIGRTLRDKPIFTGMLSFGTAALIWMISEELLLNAHKKNLTSIEGASALYLGFLLVIILEWYG